MNDMELIDEIYKEMSEIVDEFYKENVKPIVDAKEAETWKIFEKNYERVLELEGR